MNKRQQRRRLRSLNLRLNKAQAALLFVNAQIVRELSDLLPALQPRAKASHDSGRARSSFIKAYHSSFLRE